jgi:hypothetical protein
VLEKLSKNCAQGSLLVTHVLIRYLKCKAISRRQKVNRVTSGPRWLSAEEKQELRHDMTKSSAWAKAELKRRRSAKTQKDSSHGIEKAFLSN